MYKIFQTVDEVAAYTVQRLIAKIISKPNAVLGLATGSYTLTTAKAVRGQKLTVKGRPSKTVKVLLQEANIPVVLRENWPVLLQQQQLVAIIGVAQAECKLVDDGLVLYYTKS